MDIPHSTAPEGLLARIMRRLGLERQLVIIRKNLGAAIAVLVVASVGVVLAVGALVTILRFSSFVPYVMLLRSDLHPAVRHWSSFLYAMFESAPAAFISFVLLTVAAVLLCLRFAVIYWHRMSQIETKIRTNS